MDRLVEKAAQEGERAFGEKLPYASCPYPEETPCGNHWRYEWLKAEGKAAASSYDISAILGISHSGEKLKAIAFAAKSAHQYVDSWVVNAFESGFFQELERRLNLKASRSLTCV